MNAQTSSLNISPTLLAQMTAQPLQRLPVIVQMNAAAPPFNGAVNVALAQQALNLLQANGQAVGALPIVNGAAGWANAAGIQAISQAPGVASIDEDAIVRGQRPSTSGSQWPPGASASALFTREVNADRVWQQGGSGRGVTVAVLDSGVAADPDLSARLVGAVGFAGMRDPQRPDPGGHGTHVAVTIAGNGTRSGGQYLGVAQRANILDIQVLDRNGNGRISAVMAGIQWVLAHQEQFNIRVVNLSLGIPPPTSSYRTDPFATAAEVAWRHGLVIVAAAGNRGAPPSGGSTVESPGIDPYVVTVGATDDQASVTLTDDTLAWFSAYGTPGQSTAKPDLVAPGRRIVSARVPGSTLDAMLPDHVVRANNGATYFRLTGTSMSTAVVSGAVALMLERQPGLTPDQVKKILASTTQPFGASAVRPPTGAAGSGLLDAYAAVNSANRTPANTGLRPTDGFARLVYPVVYGQPLVWNSLTYLGTTWSLFTWLTLPWTEAAWDNIAWDNVAWDNVAWDNIAWDNIAWDNIAWDQAGWDNVAWDSFGYD